MVPAPSLDRLPAGWRDVVPLGAGAFGRVYRAVDPQGAPVAVKVLAQALAADPDAGWRFAAEYRLLGRFDHPGLPRARGEGQTEAGLPFFAMDLLDGAEPSSGSPAAVRAVLAGVAAVLKHLHARGYVHGDLKPDNVRVAPDGAVRVLDVGLVAPVGERRASIAGTPAFMAPEVLRKAPVAAPSDLYALGVLGYVLRAGRPPFAGGPAEIVRGHLAEVPPALRAAEADSELDQLLLDLLAKEPGARPSAAAVLARLAGEPVPAEALGLAGGILVGRDDVRDGWRQVLGGLEAALLGVPTELATALWLPGGPGMGKGAALDACRLETQLAGRPWVGAAGGGAPGAAARAIVRQALALAGLAAEGAVAAWLAGAVPAELLELDAPARAAALNAAAAAALAGAARALGGLAIGLDDWHLADGATRDAVRRFAREPGAALGWAFALDAGATDAGATDARATNAGATHAGATDVAAPAGALVVPLGPLAASDVDALLAARLGGPVPAGLRAWLDGVAAGHPLVLDLLLEHAAATGALRSGPDGWAYEDLGGGFSGGGALAAVWAARRQGLTPEARALGAALGVAAVAGGAPLRLLAAAAGQTAEVAARAAEGLAAAGLAAEREGRLLPAAPGVAEALTSEPLAELAAETWQAVVAGRLARGWLAGGAPEAAPLEWLAAAAKLALVADEPGWAGRLAAAAGRRFMELPAPAEALGMFDAAIARLDRVPVVEWRGLHYERAEVARALDRIDEARAGYELALGLAEEPALESLSLTAGQALAGPEDLSQTDGSAGDGAADSAASGAASGAPAGTGAADSPASWLAAAWIGLAKCRQLRGDYPGAASALESAVAAAIANGRADQEARAETAWGRVALFAGQPDAALAHASAAVAAARRGGRPAVLSQALNAAGAMIVLRDPARAPEALAMLDEAIAIARRLGDRLGEAFALEGLGNARLGAGDLAGAAEAFAGNAVAAEAVGWEVELLAARLAVARVAADLGRHHEAARVAADVARRAGAANRAFVRGLALAVEGAARWRGGRPDEAAPLLAEALAVAERLKNAYMEGYVRLYRVEAALAAGDLAAAGAEAELAVARIGDAGPADVRARLACARAELARRLGDPDAARDLAGPHLDSPNRWVARAARAVLGAVALDAGDADAALDHALTARTLASDWAAPWHEAEDRLAIARAAALAGDAATAAEEARDAVAAASHDDANAYALGGAGQVLMDLGHGNEGRGALEAASMLLAPARAALGEAAAAFLAAWGLSGLAAPVGVQSGGSGGAIAASDLDAWLDAVVAERDEHRLAAAMLRGAIALVHADRGYVLAYEAGRLRGAVTQGFDYAAEVESGFSETIAARALYEAQPVYVVDASNDAAFREAASVVALGLRTVVALPLLAGDEVLGVLYMDREDVEPTLAPADLDLLMAYARTGAGLLAGVRDRRLAETEAAKWKACAELGAALVGAPDAAAARTQVLDAVLAALGADRAFWLAGDPLKAKAARGAGGRAVVVTSIGLSQGVAAWVRERGEPLVLVDAGADENWSDHRSVAALGLATVWCVPAGEGAVIYADAQGAGAGGRETLELAAALAAWAAPVLARLG